MATNNTSMLKNLKNAKMFKIIDKHLGILKDFEGKYIYIYSTIYIYMI